MGCFVMGKIMCIFYIIKGQIKRLKCFELAPGVHSTSLGLGLRADCAPPLHCTHLLRKAQKVQNWPEAKSLSLRIQNNFYDTSGQYNLTKFDAKSGTLTLSSAG